jgi:hypothetical protein
MKPIPISTARYLSQKFEYPEIVIFAYNPKTGRQHVTTYGKTKAQCLDAAQAGNYLKKALGWPEEECNAQPDLSHKEDV